MDFGGSSVPGPRPYNEDNYLLTDLSGSRRQLGGLTAFFMVSDGMGGHSSGDVASRLAVETAESYLRDLLRLAADSDLDVAPGLALQEISEESHAAIVAAAAGAGAASMGATFIAALVSKDRAWIGHVGDSRAYLLSGGTARQLTIDHSQVGRLISEGVLTEEQAQHHPQRNVIDRALGFTGATADITEVDLKPGDAILLCSDGVSTVLKAEDLVGIASGAPDAAHAAAAITAEAVRADSDDNCTAVIWANDWVAFSAAAGGNRPRRAGSKRRALPSRHARAQKASLWAMGVLGLIMVVVVAIFAFGGGGAKGSAASVATPGKITPRGVEASPSVPTTRVPAADASITTTEVPKSPPFYLRSDASSTGKGVATLKPGAQLKYYTVETVDKIRYLRVHVSDVTEDIVSYGWSTIKKLKPEVDLYVRSWH